MRLIHEKLMPDTATATIVTRQVQVGLRPTCPERSAHSIVAAFQWGRDPIDVERK